MTSNIPAGEWDLDILNEIFADIDLMSLGLNVDEIALPEDNLPADLRSEKEEDFNPEPPVDSISKSGDIYEFISIQKGLKHKLICGDSTNSQVYDLIFQDESMDLLCTDPPYNVNYEGGTKDHLKIKNDNMKSDDFYRFLFNFYSCCFQKARPGAPAYVFHADSEGVNFRKAFIDAGFKLSQCLIWLKNSIVLSRHDYHWKHEPCLLGEVPADVPDNLVTHDPVLYGWKTGAAHPWYSDRKQSTILEFKRPHRSEDHPTMKPIDMIIYLIKNSSRQRDIVCDPFGGSGTTLISCEQTWRNARVIELDERFVDVHVKRYVKYMRDNFIDFKVLRNGVELSQELLDKFLKI